MAFTSKRNFMLTCDFHHWIEQTKLLLLVIKKNESKGAICWEEFADYFTLTTTTFLQLVTKMVITPHYDT